MVMQLVAFRAVDDAPTLTILATGERRSTIISRR